MSILTQPLSANPEGLPKEAEVEVDGGKFTSKRIKPSLTVKGEDKKMTIKELTDSKRVLANAEGKELTFAKKE
jgi:hypothetical protein